MALIGDGSKNNPYTFDPTNMTPVQVWEHFLELVSATGTYGELPVNYVLDMNEVDTDIDSIISINIRHLNAQGFTIKNLRSTAEYIFSLNSSAASFDEYTHTCNIIYDLHLENLYGKRLLTQGSAGPNEQYWSYFYGLTVSGYFTTTDAIINCTTSTYYNYEWASSSYTNKGCGFNVKVPRGNFITAHGDDKEIFKDCYIKFVGKKFSSGNMSPSQVSISDKFTLDNCLLEGKCTGLWISKSITSVINIEIVNPSNIGCYIYNSSLSLINTSKVRTGWGSENCIKVTDEQMKNVTYLQKQGFPILD